MRDTADVERGERWLGTAEWGRLAVIVEWAALLLMAQEFLTESRLASFSVAMRRLAVALLVLPDRLTVGPFRTQSRDPLAVRMDAAWLRIRTSWRAEPLYRIIITSLFLPAPALLFLFLGLPWPHKWIPVGVAVIGQLALGYVSRGEHFRFFRLFGVTIIGGVVFGLFWSLMLAAAAAALSIDLWVLAPFALAYGGLRALAGSVTLRTYLFVSGVLLFTAGKGIEFVLVR